MSSSSPFSVVSYVLVLWFFVEVTGEPVVPKAWPPAFNVTFLTNIVSNEYATIMGTDHRRSPIKSMLYYDYASYESQLIRHGAGSYECAHFYNTLDPCTLLVNADAMYRLMTPNQESNSAHDCCLDLPNVTCPPPTWPVLATEGREYLGDETVSGVVTHHWRWPMGEQSYSHYYQDVETDLPMLWTFPVANGRQDWHFVLETFDLGRQESDLFVLPDSSCTKKQCPKRQSLDDKKSFAGSTL